MNLSRLYCYIWGSVSNFFKWINLFMLSYCNQEMSWQRLNVTINSINLIPAVHYPYLNLCQSYGNVYISWIWVRSITLVNEQCSYCNITYTEYLSHIFKSCITADRREIFYLGISTVGIELVNALKIISDNTFFTALLTCDISNERHYDEKIKFQFLRFPYDYIDSMLLL